MSSSRYQSRIAFVFPGQGAQQVGMGQDFYSTEAGKTVFDTFNQHVCPELSDVCFNGPEETLKETRYTQPAILATALAALKSFQQVFPDIQPVVTAGHSLGEYGALFAANVIDLETAAKLIQKRAQLMQSAPAGSMAAIIAKPKSDFPVDQLEAIIQQVNDSGQGPVTIANYNTPEQFILSGTPEGVEAVSTKLDALPVKRILPLNVGGAFHSPLMTEAAKAFSEFLTGFTFQDSTIPVVTNVDAQLEQSGKAFQQKLGQQINGSVRWTQTMERLVHEANIDTLIEFGPGKVLTGMIKKTYPEVRIINISTAADIEALQASLIAAV